METNNVQLCRICISANVGSTQMISIFGEDSLWQKITTLADVKIEKGDTLPQQVCVTCAKNAISACLFKKKCEDADNFFRQQLLIQKFESRTSAGSNASVVQQEVDSTEQVPEVAAMECYGGSDNEEQPDHSNISANGLPSSAINEEDDGEIKFPYYKQPFDFHSIRLMHEYMQQQLSKINGPHKNTGAGNSGPNSDDGADEDDDDDPLPLMPEVELLTPGDEMVVGGSNNDNMATYGSMDQTVLRGYQCPDCLQIFEMKQILKAHMQSVHGTQGPVYECTNCKKTYFYKRFLEKHIRRGRCVKKRRNQTRPMQCSDCHVLFPTGHHLGWHKRTGCPSRAAKMPLQQLLKQNIVEYNNFPKRTGTRKPENALYLHNRKLHMANNKRKGRTRIKLDSKKIALAKQLILREATTTVIANELNISRTFAWRLRKSLVNGVSLHERVIDTNNGEEGDEAVAQPMVADSTEQLQQVYSFTQQTDQFVHTERMVKQEKSESDGSEEDEPVGAGSVCITKSDNGVVEQTKNNEAHSRSVHIPGEQIYTEAHVLVANKQIRAEEMAMTGNSNLMRQQMLQLQQQQHQTNNANAEDDDDDNDDDDDDDDDDDGDDGEEDNDNGGENKEINSDDDGDDDDDDDDDDETDDSEENNEENKKGQVQAQKIQMQQQVEVQEKYQQQKPQTQQEQIKALIIMPQQVVHRAETPAQTSHISPQEHRRPNYGKESSVQPNLSVVNQLPSTVSAPIHPLPVNLSIRPLHKAQNHGSENIKTSTPPTAVTTKKPRKPNVFIDDEKYAMAKTLVAQNSSTMEIARALNVSQMTAWKVRDAIVKGLPLSYRNKRDGRSVSNSSSVSGETTASAVPESVESQMAHQLLLQQQLQQEHYRQEQLQLQQQQQQQQQKRLQQQQQQLQQQQQQERMRLLQRQQQIKAQQNMQLKQQQLNEQLERQQQQQHQHQQPQSEKTQRNGEHYATSQTSTPPPRYEQSTATSTTNTNSVAPVKFVHPRRRLKAAEREQRDKEITREILELIREDSNIQYWKVSARLAEKGFPISPSSVCQKLKSMGIHRRWKPGDKPPMMVDMEQLKAVSAIASNLVQPPNSTEEGYEHQFEMGGAHFLSAFTR